MIKPAPRPKLKPLQLGTLPVDEINAALDLELEHGTVIFSVPAQKHARDRHPDDYDACLTFVGMAVRDPTYVGDDLKNPGKIELIRRMPDQRGLLVAIALERDLLGRYHVCSMYPVPQGTIDRRRQAGHLRIVLKQPKSPAG